MNKKLLIGITGMSGSGKGTVVDILKQKGFLHFSASDFIAEEVVRRGVSVDRATLIAVGNDLRQKFGAGYIADELLKKASSVESSVIIESIRTLGEIDRLKENGGILLAVDADQKLRFERMKKRGGVKDGVSWEEFVEQERGESESTDPNKQNLSACRDRADFVVNNDGTITDLEVQVNVFLKKYEQ